MKITLIYNTVCAFATQRNATQRNATQRNAYHHYILNNNFKFYIFQFFRAFNFLSAVFGFAKISSFLKSNQNICSFFYREKRTKKAPSFVKRSKTTPFRIRNSLVKTLSLRGDSRSNLNLVKFDFYNLISLINKFYTKWIATPSLRSARNDSAFFRHYERKRSNLFINKLNHAFSYALKNQFEIISRNENYAFNQNKYFYRNGNNRIDKLISHSPKASYGNERKRSNLFCVDCFASIEARNDGDDLFSRNDYGGKFIFGFWNNLNFGFLFNRKILKTKI